MNEIIKAISEVTKVLEAVGVEHAITGSVASGLYGEPVATQDVDIVLRMTPEQGRRIAGMLPARFYRSEQALVEAAENQGFVNLIDMDSSFKVDLSVVPATGFYGDVLQRRKEKPFQEGGPSFQVVSSEDIILMKLLWRKDTRSTKQWENALSVARVQGARMDWAYLFKQAEALDIVDDLTKLRDEAGI